MRKVYAEKLPEGWPTQSGLT